jgi:hypothetical protein
LISISKFGYKTNNWTKVYFIQGEKGGPIKIGHTDNIERRMKQMQTGNPDKLILLHLTRGGKILEGELQERFKEHHYRGEWFHPSNQLLDYIADLIEKDKIEPKLLSIVELSLAFGELLTNNDKHLLQEIVNGTKLAEGYNWSRYLGLYKDYQDYLKDSVGFIEKYRKYLKL